MQKILFFYSSQSKYTKMTASAISIKDILSVIKNDVRFLGNQKQLQSVNIAISAAKGDKKDIIAFAKEVKSLLHSQSK